MNQNAKERNERVKWHQEARFGMFLHWGLYAIPARGEWVRSKERMTVEEYEPFFQEFDPEQYDPKEWAHLAKEAGMKYAVLTAKHHDGFCLFDSALTDYKSTNTPAKRDLVQEFLEAFRAEGIRVGLYYSVIDWHHPDFPHYGDMHHPMRDNETYSNEGRDFNRYLDYMFGQIRELLTNYGKLDIMWFDFSYGNMRAETWHAKELIDMVRSIQPDILVDNRLEGSGESSGSILTGNPTSYAGDFASPEQMIPPYGLRDDEGNPIPWESCVTLNNNWGYAAADHHYKTSKMVIHMLVECVSKGGNLLLNVGPNARGQFPEESVRILKEIGAWMKNNHDSIYGCGLPDLEKPEWGRYTRRGNHLYAHVMEAQAGAICLPGLAGRVARIRLLADGSEIRQSDYWNLKEYGENAFFFLNPDTADCYPLPDEKDTVVEILLKKA